MSMIAFDTLRASKLLRDAGVDERQAEAFVQVVQQTADLPPIDHLATKRDLESLGFATKLDVDGLRVELHTLRVETKADIENLRVETKADIENLRVETKADIENLRVETKADIENLRVETRAATLVLTARMAAQKAELIWWVMGVGAVGIVVQSGLKLFHLG
jgi:hypothetical protein